MAGQAKVIIITSNEDLIRKISLNKITDTHIIALINDNQITSIPKDNKNINDLDFLSQLLVLNSRNNQIYKRALDSSDDNQSKPVKTQKKSIDMICTICGDHAVGFNYDVLSCASCKIFFRRNAAYQHSEKLRCLKGQGQCSVAYGTRRKCPRCRLNRCFAMGMRKDFILSEEEKQRRKKHLEENVNISSKRSSTSESTNSSPQLVSNLEVRSEIADEIDHLPTDGDDNIIVIHESTNSNQIKDTLLEMLSAKDLVTIQSMRSLFLSIFQDHNTQCACVDVSDRISALISWSQFVSQSTLNFINFFRQINEFENLRTDDRFILIKYNLFSLFLVSKCFYYKPLHDCCSNDNNEAAEKHRRFFMLCGDSYGIRDTFINLVLSLVKVTEQDPTLLSLLLPILIFSQGLSMNVDEPILKDSLAVNRAQCYYTKLLWNYLVSKRGEVQACRHFTQLLTVIIRIQSVGKIIREFFCIQSMTSDTVDKIAPLMQTVLLIP